MKCRALFALDKMGVARGGDIAVRVGRFDRTRIYSRQRRDRGDFLLFSYFCCSRKWV